ncbi:MAG: radical SAM protein [Nitrospirota bacterium]|nr:radical SAM protein [Nitrospirota bacterium]
MNLSVSGFVMNRKLVDKANYLISKEKGTVFKDPGGRINIALVYPNRYAVGMASLGYQGIYGFLNSMHDVVCERVFLPEEGDIDEHIRTNTRPFSLESKRTLDKFDIIAFSVSFENDYPHIVKILKMAQIPLKSIERDDSYPLVIMGGVCAFYNPEPLSGFIDVSFTGEAEEMLGEFLSMYRGYRGKADLFRRLLSQEGIYIPRFYSVACDDSGRIISREAGNNAPAMIRKQTIADISKSFLKSAITSPEIEFSDMYLLEAMRGCPWSCRFCLAGQIYKPARKKDFAVLKAEIEEALTMTRRVGLIGPSLSDYPHAEEVLMMEGVDFSITSLRANIKSARIAALMKGHKSVSIAPEAGTERLRKVINKRISEEDILETAQCILDGDIETLRLYFMIGLPTETAEDAGGIIDLVKKIRGNSKRGHITLSVSTFVPKPFTPFQWHPMVPLKEIKERLKMIKKGLLDERGVRVFHDVPKYAHIQGLFAMGDRRVGALIEKIASGDPLAAKDRLFKESLDFYIFRKKELSEILPWDFIDAGISKEKLWNEYQKALEG